MSTSKSKSRSLVSPDQETKKIGRCRNDAARREGATKPSCTRPAFTASAFARAGSASRPSTTSTSEERFATTCVACGEDSKGPHATDAAPNPLLERREQPLDERRPPEDDDRAQDPEVVQVPRVAARHGARQVELVLVAGEERLAHVARAAVPEIARAEERPLRGGVNGWWAAPESARPRPCRRASLWPSAPPGGRGGSACARSARAWRTMA